MVNQKRVYKFSTSIFVFVLKYKYQRGNDATICGYDFKPITNQDLLSGSLPFYFLYLCLLAIVQLVTVRYNGTRFQFVNKATQNKPKHYQLQLSTWVHVTYSINSGCGCVACLRAQNRPVGVITSASSSGPRVHFYSILRTASSATL
jgi:hypothetical protein